MTDRIEFDCANSALLSMDCQNGIVSRYVREQEEGSHAASMMQRAAEAMKRGRHLGMPVIPVADAKSRKRLEPEVGLGAYRVFVCYG